MRKQQDKKHGRLLTAFERLADCLLTVLEYVSHSGSWKRWFRMLFSLSLAVMKGDSHG